METGKHGKRKFYGYGVRVYSKTFLAPTGAKGVKIFVCDIMLKRAQKEFCRVLKVLKGEPKYNRA